jgi:hypothetical protein
VDLGGSVVVVVGSGIGGGGGGDGGGGIGGGGGDSGGRGSVGGSVCGSVSCLAGGNAGGWPGRDCETAVPPELRELWESGVYEYSPAAETAFCGRPQPPVPAPAGRRVGCRGRCASDEDSDNDPAEQTRPQIRRRRASAASSLLPSAGATRPARDWPTEAAAPPAACLERSGAQPEAGSPFERRRGADSDAVAAGIEPGRGPDGAVEPLGRPERARPLAPPQEPKLESRPEPGLVVVDIVSDNDCGAAEAEDVGPPPAAARRSGAADTGPLAGTSESGPAVTLQELVGQEGETVIILDSD